MLLAYGVSEHWSHFVRVILYNLVMLNINTMLTIYCMFMKLICIIFQRCMNLCFVNTEEKFKSNVSQLIILRNFYGWQICFSTYFWWYWINFLNFCPEKTVMSTIWRHRRYETWHQLSRVTCWTCCWYKIYIYVYVYIHKYMYIYIYIYI